MVRITSLYFYFYSRFFFAPSRTLLVSANAAKAANPNLKASSLNALSSRDRSATFFEDAFRR